MQRQSLGSPSSKLQINGGKEERQDQEEEKRKPVVEEEEEEEEVEGDKRTDKLLRPTSRIDKSIHLIPVLTIFCLLVLYLFSYDPSQKDMENAGVMEGYFPPKDPTDIGRFGRLLEIGGNSKSSAIIGRRALKEERNRATSLLPSSDLHRKFGYF